MVSGVLDWPLAFQFLSLWGAPLGFYVQWFLEMKERPGSRSKLLAIAIGESAFALLAVDGLASARDGHTRLRRGQLERLCENVSGVADPRTRSVFAGYKLEYGASPTVPTTTTTSTIACDLPQAQLCLQQRSLLRI